MSYAAQERFEASIAAYREAARLNPDLARLVDQSIELVGRLQRVKERPTDAEAHRSLGELYASDGRSDRAIECFEKVVALAPRGPEGFWSLARQYELEARDADALRAWEQGLALDPGNVPARNNREKLLIKTALALGRPVTLALGPDQAVVVDPARGASYYQLGLRHLRNDEAGGSGGHSAAGGRARARRGRCPPVPRPGVHLARRRCGCGGCLPAGDRPPPDQSERLQLPRPRVPPAAALPRGPGRLRRAVAQAPGYAVAYVNLAATHEALGERVEALAAYRLALRHDANLSAVQEKIDALGTAGGR